MSALVGKYGSPGATSSSTVPNNTQRLLMQMTQADAERLHDWLVRRFGEPSEGTSRKALPDGDANEQHQKNPERDRDSRIRRHEHADHEQGDH